MILLGIFLYFYEFLTILTQKFPTLKSLLLIFSQIVNIANKNFLKKGIDKRNVNAYHLCVKVRSEMIKRVTVQSGMSFWGKTYAFFCSFM